MLHGDALVEQVAHERDDHHLVLEHLEEPRRALGGRERLVLGRDPARAADVQRLDRSRRRRSSRTPPRTARDEPVDAVVAAESAVTGSSVNA